MLLVAAGLGSVLSIGAYLPLTDTTDHTYSKQLNKHASVMGPCVLSCIMTPVILGIFWFNYDTLIGEGYGNYIGGILALTFMVGGSIDAAHELLHRHEFGFKALSYIDLYFFQFTVYPTEHLYLHHKKVGSPEDPVTSPKNQSYYSYLARVLKSAYSFNYNYCKKTFALCLLATLSYNIGLLYFSLREGSGASKAVFFSITSYTSIVIMELVEYIEHYGLQYRKTADGQPLEISSWNSTKHELLSLIIFRFQKHSDHHMNAHKVYPAMEINEKMPLFPFDFISGIIMATNPSKWFSVMNPLVDNVLEGKPVEKSHYD